MHIQLGDMIYNLQNDLSLAQFKARAKKLIERGALVELTDKTIRSSQQNRYLHALLGAMALETGNTLEYVKLEYYKKTANPSIFVVPKKDVILGESYDIRSSAELTVEEMNLSISRFKEWAGQEGYYLPEEGDEAILREIEIQMQTARRFL